MTEANLMTGHAMAAPRLGGDVGSHSLSWPLVSSWSLQGVIMWELIQGSKHCVPKHQKRIGGT